MDIIPLEGVGPIRFGDSRQHVRNVLASPYTTFRKASGSNETDAFDELDLHVYYGGEDLVEFIEAFSPASISFCGLQLMGRALGNIDEELRALGCSPEQADVGLKYESAGIALYAPNGIVESVGVFRRGYYDT